MKPNPQNAPNNVGPKPSGEALRTRCYKCGQKPVVHLCPDDSGEEYYPVPGRPAPTDEEIERVWEFHGGSKQDFINRDEFYAAIRELLNG